MRWNTQPRLRARRRRRRRPVPRRVRPLDLPRSPAAAPLPGRAGRARARLPGPRSAGQGRRRRRCSAPPSRRWSCDRSLSYIGFTSPNAEEWTSLRPRGPRARGRRAADPTARFACARRRRPSHHHPPWRSRRPRLSRLGRRRTRRARGRGHVRSRRQGSTSTRGDAELAAAARASTAIAWFHDPFGFRHELSHGPAPGAAPFRPGRPMIGLRHRRRRARPRRAVRPRPGRGRALLHRRAWLPALRRRRGRHQHPLPPLQRPPPQPRVRRGARHGRACTT